MVKRKEKFKYQKPTLVLENFAISANIAANCEGMNKVFSSMGSCTIPHSFLVHSDDNNCGVDFGCYQVPTGDTLFGS